MSVQLVLRGNRVLSHGEDCFLCVGGSVICADSGRTFENATVVNHPGEIPSDIDEVGYEYHAGAFIPCAPFGKGDGNLAVVCGEDCKTIKDGSFPLSLLFNGGVPAAARIVQGTYVGLGKTSTVTPYRNTLTFDGKPLAVLLYLVGDWGSVGNSDTEKHAGNTFMLMRGVTSVQRGNAVVPTTGNGWNSNDYKVNVQWGENSVSWITATEHTSADVVMWGEKSRVYGYLALLGGE